MSLEIQDISIRFVLKKAEGTRPERSELSNAELEDFRHCITLNLVWESFQISEKYSDVRVMAIEIVYDGCTIIDEEQSFGYRIDKDGLVGYPAPIVRFSLNKPVDPDVFNFGIRETDLEVTTVSREQAGKDPFYAEDHNGYCSPIGEGEQQAWREAILDAGVFSAYKETFSNGMTEFGYPIAGRDFIATPVRIED